MRVPGGRIRFVSFRFVSFRFVSSTSTRGGMVKLGGTRSVSFNTEDTEFYGEALKICEYSRQIWW